MNVFRTEIAGPANRAILHRPLITEYSDMAETLKMTQPLIVAEAISKSYFKGEHKVPVLRGAGLRAHRGEFISVIGQSGSGKSTLLHVMGLLDSPDEVKVFTILSVRHMQAPLFLLP